MDAELDSDWYIDTDREGGKEGKRKNMFDMNKYRNRKTNKMEFYNPVMGSRLITQDKHIFYEWIIY